MKKWIFMVVFLFVLVGCNPVDDPVDCETNPTHEECQPDPVDCTVTPHHEDCEPEPVDCDANPTHEECQPDPVDCDVTPDHEDCEPDPVDCDVTPDHEDCQLCESNETEIDGICYLNNDPFLLINTALTQTSQIENYTMTVSITEGEQSFTILIAIDDNTSMYQDDNETRYYISDGTACSTVIESFGRITTEENTCSSDEFSYFKDFNPEWFSLEAGVFQLKDEFTDDAALIWSNDDSIDVVNISIQIEDGYLVLINTELAINEEPYTILMSLSAINSTLIDIPEVGE